MSGHTPGPWVIGNENNQCCDVECGDGRTSVSLSRFDSLMRDEFAISRDEMLANARLIAAAPELLEALRPFANAALDRSLREALIEAVKPNERASMRLALEAARAASAKARGGK